MSRIKNWKKYLKWAPEAKSATKNSSSKQYFAMSNFGFPDWSHRNYETLINEGYCKNPIVYRCIKMIADAATSIPWKMYIGDKEIYNHPALELLNNPNPTANGQCLWEGVYSSILTSGNAYLLLNILDDKPQEMFSLNPDRVNIQNNYQGVPHAYLYNYGNKKKAYYFSREYSSELLHLMLHNPLNDHCGHSPLDTAQTSLDLYNAACNWNKALLDNSARPSGAIIYQSSNGENMSDEQFERLKQELENNYQGATNAGRPMLLEGGLDWRTMSLSPHEMEFNEIKNSAARDIALVFGVPPMILGIKGDNTYSNYKEANRALWSQTIIPLISKVSTSLTYWLSNHYKEELKISFNINSITAISEERTKLWSRINSADFLTEDEKRKAVGYGRKRN